MTSKSMTLISIVNQSLFFAAIYLVLLRLAHGSDFPFLSGLWLLIPVALTTLLLPKAKKAWQLLVLHGLFFFLPFFYTKDLYIWAFYCLTLILITLFHYADSRTGFQQAFCLVPRFWFGLFHAVLALFAYWQKESFLYQYGTIAFTVSLIFFLLYQFLSNKQRFFEQNREIAELPKNQIHRVTRFIMILFFSVLILSILLAAVSGLGEQIVRLFHVFGELLRSLLQRIFRIGEAEPPSTYPGDFTVGIAGPTGDNAAPWFALLLDVFFYLLFFCFIIAVLAGIVMVVYRIFAYYHNVLPDNKDEIEFLTPFVKTESTLSSGSKEPRKTRFDFSPNTKVRKAYTKAIQLRKQKDQRLSPAYTPTQLEQAVSLDSPLLHQLYEKARYSAEGCDAADADLAKKQVKS